MLPSKKRLSRSSFVEFSSSKDIKSVFNTLGTLKYRKGLKNQASVVISSKNEKLAVSRNKLRRKLYILFTFLFKKDTSNIQYILYLSRGVSKLKNEELTNLFHELIKKTTK